MTKKYIKPVIRFPGSKYKLLPCLFKEFERIENQIGQFFDLFGGSGIVGVNFKNRYKHLQVFINDFDKILKPLNKNFLIKNQTSYGGFGKHKTNAAIKQFEKRINNGYWEKVEIYKKCLENIEIYHDDMNSFKVSNVNEKIFSHTLLYLDPPYSKSNQQKQYKNCVDFQSLITKVSRLKDIKIMISLNHDHNYKIPKKWKIKEVPITYLNSSNNKVKKTKELIITNF